MPITITHTWDHLGRKPGSPPTIWEALAAKLGREPTDAEARAEVERILDESHVKRKG